jgi:Cof subfamily protein (haloacid dehalogenase superfamily)
VFDPNKNRHNNESENVMNQTAHLKAPKISLLIADVDGTLVTREKVLTARARAAIGKLNEAGIIFTITSGRPPLGMKMIVDALNLSAPIAAFNGGVFLRPDFFIIDQNVLREAIANQVVEIITAHGLDVWVYRGNDWFVHERHGPHVDREEWTVKFSPTVVSSFDGLLDNVAKIVGVSDNLQAVQKCEVDVQREFNAQVCCQASASSGAGEQISAARSQPYYLDVTHPRANKGAVVERLCEFLSFLLTRLLPLAIWLTNVPMFERSGLSIAMGNASAEVQRQAQYVTTSNEEEGFCQCSGTLHFGQSQLGTSCRPKLKAVSRQWSVLNQWFR